MATPGSEPRDDTARRRPFCWLSFLALGLALGCSDDDTCRADCPVMDVPPEPGDVRLEVDAETAFPRLDPGGAAASVVAGELVLRPDERGCAASQDHPCTFTIRRLQIRISDFTASGYDLAQPELSIAGPVEVTDSGFGIVLPEETIVDTCVTVDGEPQHARAQSLAVTTMNFDDSGASPLGSLEGVWPLVFAKRESDCQRASISVTLVAALRAAH